MVQWSEEKIVQEIKNRFNLGKSLTYTDVRNECPSLMSAIEKRYGSWYKTLELAGINSQMHRKQNPFGFWDKKRVLFEIKKLESEGKNLTMSKIRKTNCTLVQYAIEFYGGWYEALDLCGIDSSKYRMAVSPNYWTKTKIIEEVKDHHAKGDDIRPIALMKAHPGLMGASRKYFETTEGMYEAAGINPSNIGMQNKWNKESIINALIRLVANGQNIKPHALSKSGYSGLASAGKRIFGSYENMYSAAGIDYNSLNIRKMRCKKYTKEIVINTLNELIKNEEDISIKALMKNHSSLHISAVRLFGNSWNMYLAAGLDPSLYSKMRSRGYWTNRRIIEEIFQLFMQETDLHFASIKKSHSSLVRAAYHKFGSWHKACEAAGVPEEKYLVNLYNYYTEDVIKTSILDLHHKDINLSGQSIAKTHPSLYAAALSKYNSWYTALEEAGINSDKYRALLARGYWTKTRIINEIEGLSQEIIDLSYSNASKIRPDLVSMADKRFGSWSKALSEMGIDYDSMRKQHKKYSKTELLEFLVQLRDKGITLDWTTVRDINPSIVMAINKNFGGYDKAIQELGLDYNLIRRDGFRESYKGKVFELYAKEAFEKVGWKVEFKKVFKFEGEKCIPDFWDISTKLWIDAKLDSHTWGVERSILKYLKYTDKLLVIYLKGKERYWSNNSVEFMPISNLFELLRENGAEELIYDFEKLKKNILRPNLQARLDRYIQKETT